jgi:hypothetical protein
MIGQAELDRIVKVNTKFKKKYRLIDNVCQCCGSGTKVRSVGGQGQL